MTCDSVINHMVDGEPVDLPCRFDEHEPGTDHNHQGPRFSTWWNDDEPTARRTNQGANHG